MSHTPSSRSRRAARCAVLAAVALAACRAAPAMPMPAPGAGPTSNAAPAAPTSPADVRFLQHMIPHHAQALVMTALVPPRTETPGVRLVAERIAASQRSEIATMQQWLRRHGEEVPAVDSSQAHAGHAMPSGDTTHAGMPGMLTDAELQRLADASGAEFDRLFLEYMIRHHEGALQMVAELLAAPGGAQQSEVFQIANDVDADQRAEIARMRALQGR